MTSSLGRLARLTLFSGPNCSLCDVRCRSSFVQDSRLTNVISTGCKGGASKGQADSPIPAGDHRHSGRGTGEVEEEIHILDSGTAYRWGGRQGPMGRDARQSSPRPVGEGTPEDGWRCLDNSQLFFVDTRETASYWDYWMHPGAIAYNPLGERLLGEPERAKEDTEPSQSTPSHLCFNCGSAGHLLSSCPKPRNRALVDLSRQMFVFFADGGSQTRKRFHEVEEWKSRRLKWVHTYKPGEITDFLLREALGSGDMCGALNMPWLENISLWGYPPGWISCEDPVERVRRRILDEDEPCSGVEGLDNDSCLFVVLNDTPEDSEILQLDSSFTSVPSDPPSEARTPRRWAVYPKAYFLSELLPVYTGRVLPLTEPTQLDGQHETCSPPPPPPGSPPPLPPPFHHSINLFYDEVDMDLSD